MGSGREEEPVPILQWVGAGWLFVCEGLHVCYHPDFVKYASGFLIM